MFRVAALLSFCGLLASCQDCPLIGCGSALQVSIGNGEQPLEMAVHVVEVEFDGEDYVVQCHPQVGCWSEEGGVLYPVQGEFMDGTIELWVGNGGDAPESVGIRVSIEDELVLEDELTPSYEEYDRAGEGCGVCERAEVLLDVAVAPT